ncbi:hypothetical protein Acsp05_02930 [Actinokineospora sp. NBRC 105648]|nr:hypothetical protein Acsp05_02930 [Actinokineospora sp. NBRC 105648]
MARLVPALPARAWVLRTAAAASSAHVLGLLPSLTGQPWVAGVVGLPPLLSLGVAQWSVLRGLVPWAARWVTATALGWLVGLAVSWASRPRCGARSSRTWSRR